MWDNNTGEIDGFNHYGYDGEDFISLDLKTLTWEALTQQAVAITKIQDTDKIRERFNEVYLTQFCPQWLQIYLDLGKSTLMKTGEICR